MVSFSLRGALSAAALLSCGVRASAHVTLGRPTAVPDTTYRGVLQVNHGCRGAATTAISVTIPEGIIGVRPVPKPGWTLTIDRAAYKRPYKLYGETLTEGPRTLTWSAGTLPDDEYHEFTFVARVTGDYVSGATLFFPVVQELRCYCVTLGGVAGNRAGICSVGTARAGGPRHCRRERCRPGRCHARPRHEHAYGGRGQGGTRRHVRAHRQIRRDRDRDALDARDSRRRPGCRRLSPPDEHGLRARPLDRHLDPARKAREVHEMSTDGGVMKMHEVEGGLEIKPGQTVELKPGGYHLMFLDLIAAHKQDKEIKGTLTFAKAGTVTVVFPVAAIGTPPRPPSKYPL